MHVLVVEDDIDLCDTLGLLMDSLGAVCIKAASLEAVKNLKLENLDVAVLDVNLGSGQPSGLDIYHYLCGEFKIFRTIFLTGHMASHPLVQEVKLLRNVKVLSKPVDIEEISRALVGATQ
jgi:ActR/RegA family two-component response regulator